MKRCPRCSVRKQLEEFHRHGRRKDGRQPYCRACRAEIDHARYERLRDTGARRNRNFERERAEWLRSLKAQIPCADCGRLYAPEVMQWDHLPGTRKAGEVSSLKGRSKDEILAEIAKCELVCANCHAIRTQARRPTRERTRRPPARAYRRRPVSLARPVAVPLSHRCARCGLVKPISEFHNSRTRQFSYCRDCRREYDRRYYARRSRPVRLVRQKARAAEATDWLHGLKRDEPCTDCREIFPPFVMQWDHLPDVEKRGDVSRMVKASRAVILDEIAKCELVCANCHAIRTARRNALVSTDGSDPSLYCLRELSAAYSAVA